MAEENPSGTPTPGTTVPKKETVRITLPSKPGDATGVKRETVRLGSVPPPPAAPAAPVTEPAYDNSLKGQTIRITPMSATPKKETTRVATAPIKPAPPAAPASSVPPMPAPPAFNAPAPLGPPKPLPPSGALPAVKPVAPSGMPPKPPGLAPKPPVPAMPPAPAAAPAAAAAVPSAAAVPTGLKAAPKKETARIQVAPTGGPTMPKATVKMAQTQPMIAAVPAMPKKSEALAVAANDEPQGSDVGLVILSILATITSGAAAVACYLAYTALNSL
ncbi:MAG: hypothetical protein WCD79_06750 [Chthoniobacteraceae bacterium]